MIQIRAGVFETNSSSVHSLTMCTEKEMQDWVDGKAFFNMYGKEPWVPVTPKLLAMDPEERMGGEELYGYQEYWDKVTDSWFYEGFEKSYTTPSGEKVYAFGYYGEDR